MNRRLSSSSESSEKPSHQDLPARTEFPQGNEDSDTERASNTVTPTTTLLRERLAEPAAGILAADESDSDFMLHWQELARKENEAYDIPFLGDLVEPDAATILKLTPTGSEVPSSSAESFDSTSKADDYSATVTSNSTPGTPSKIRGQTLVHGSLEANGTARKRSIDTEGEGDERDLEAALTAVSTMDTTADVSPEDGGACGKKPDFTAEAEVCNRRRRICYYVGIGIAIGILLIVLGTVLGLRNKRQKASQTSSTGAVSSNEELSAPKDNPTPSKCFKTTQELIAAIDTYLARPIQQAHHDIARTYGHPMNEWCVSTVTNFDSAFSSQRAHSNRTALERFNEPLHKWDLSGATSIAFMFAGAKSFNQNIDAWNTASVRNMSQAFAGCHAYNQPMNSWKTGQVEDFSSMFNGAVAFNGPLGLWETRSALSFRGMFQDAVSFNQPLTTWDVRLAMDFSRMFYNASSFAQDLCPWIVGIRSTANLSQMFDQASSCPARAITPDIDFGGPFCSLCLLPGNDGRSEPPPLPEVVEVPVEIDTNNRTD